ncbi:MAG: hypothetical protein Q9198_004765 [Flavoplaca austrocitrina]
MPDFFWPDDELSFKEQWPILKKHFSSLRDVDQVKVMSACRTFVGLSASGAVIGLGLGWTLTRRLRRSRLEIANMFNNPLGQQTAMGFPNGRTRILEIAATNVSVIGGATIIGACFGMLFGIGVADRKLRKDMESRERIVLACKRYRTELYRKEAKHIETTLSDSGSVEPL